MAGFLSTKMKRKDLDEVYDEFSEFSLSSPARKIRRLDAELPSIMEEEDASVPLSVKQQMPEVLVMDEAKVSLSLNEERALVLYKPVENPFDLSPSSSNVSFTVSSDLVTGLKNQAFWPGNHRAVTIEEVPADNNQTQADANNSLAIIRWIQSTTASGSKNMYVEEPMEAEEVGDASMEVEEDVAQANSNSLHQWKQHCMIPQPPQNTATPIMWSWR